MQFKPVAPAFLALGLAVGLVGCAREAAEEGAAEQPSMEEAATTTMASADMLADVRGDYVEHYNMGHASVVADLYTNDGVYMPAGGALAVGREAITAVLDASVAGGPTLNVEAQETIIQGDVAFERGTYSVEVTPEGMEPTGFSGYYVTFSKKQMDGSWKLDWVLSNYDSEPSAEIAASMTMGLAAGEAGGDAELDALRMAWQNAYNQGDGEAVASQHSEDGIVMFSDQPALEGRAAFAAALDEIFMSSPETTITQLDSEIVGDWAVARGMYEQELTPPEGELMSQAGYWLSVSRRADDGSWKLHWLITNSVAPSM